MKWFRATYLWAMNAKLYMALYFIVMLFALGIASALSGVFTVPLLTLVEMLLTCALVAALQRLLLDDRVDYARGVFIGRTALWLVLSTLLALGAALLFRWFAGFPGWVVAVFGAFWMLALGLVLLGLRFEQEADTEHLNADLHRYQTHT